MGLVASCDIVCASDNASFGLPEISVGVLGGARHARRLISEGLTRYMAFTGERLSAAEMAAAGGVHRLVSDTELESTALGIARIIASKSPVAIRTLKAGLNLIELSDMNLLEGYRYEQGLTGSIASHPFSQEAAAAFFEKRQPRFVA
jgi:enoyl-CoA hydratase